MAGEGRTWRTWQLLVVAAVALVVGITAGASTKTKTSTVSAGAGPAVTATEAPATSPPTTARSTTTPAPTSPPTTAGPKTSFSGDGTYLVGKDIAPGTYRTAGPKQSGALGLCYWERDSDLSGNFSAVIANDNLKGPGVVTIAATDKGFKTSGCQEWTQA